MKEEKGSLFSCSQSDPYDLIIVGAGCVGVAAAYEAKRKYPEKKVCIIEKSDIQSKSRYWSSSFSARQNRIQYTEKYLTEFVIESNKKWMEIQAQTKDLRLKLNPNKDIPDRPFKYVEGALWFGDRKMTTSEGNILEANAILTKINQTRKPTVNRLYMEKILQNQPSFMQAFHEDSDKENHQEWDAWVALYQPDGGSIDMEFTYKVFLEDIKDQIKIFDQCNITSYEQKEVSKSVLEVEYQGKKHCVWTKALFIAAGIWTPHFLAEIIKDGEQLLQEASVQEYVSSYFKFNEEQQNFYEKFTTFINFLPEKECPLKSQPSAYGFPYHWWDDPIAKQHEKHIKIGTMAHKKIENVCKAQWASQVTDAQDERVIAAEEYVRRRMNWLSIDRNTSKHYSCPIIFYEGRETILDYVNRQRKNIVVQTGGWVGKYFPLLAQAALQMIFDGDKSHGRRSDGSDIIGNFLNRVRFPIRKHVLNQLTQQIKEQKAEQKQEIKQQMKEQKTQQKDRKLNNQVYDVAIIGAGCSGLYAAWRLHTTDPNLKIAIFEGSDRISGRLKSVRFKGTSTPIELGGMRYIQQKHQLLVEVIKKLGIPTLDFPMSGNPVQSYALKAYLRNDYFHQNEWEQQQKANQRLMTSYRLKGEIVGMTAFQMISYSLYLTFKMADNWKIIQELKYTEKVKQSTSNPLDYDITLTLEEWNHLKPRLWMKLPFPFHQKAQIPKMSLLKQSEEDLNKKSQMYPLYKFGFQNVIEAQLGHEAYNFISEQNGYYSNTSNASYLEQACIYVLDFGKINYRTLVGGYDMFHYNLANQLLDPRKGLRQKEKNKNAGIYLNHELVDITKNIIIKNAKDIIQYHLAFANKTTIIAERVILAMPRRAVEILYNKIQLLHQQLSNYKETLISNKDPPVQINNLIDLTSSTQIMPAVRIMMNFSINWWDPTVRYNQQYSQNYHNTTLINSVQQMRGVSVTDLPMRQALYFSTATDNMILASYNDMVTTTFWEAYQNNFQEQFKPTQACRLRQRMVSDEGNNGVKAVKGNSNNGKKVLVKQLLRQLSLLHGVDVKESWVKECLYQYWGADPYGGGYHNWYAGYDVEAIMKCVRKPWKDENIHIIGEAFSNMTGWIEGCLQTTEMFLKENYAVEAPIKNYYCGW